jgi:hypothetical protein
LWSAFHAVTCVPVAVVSAVVEDVSVPLTDGCFGTWAV